MATKKNTFEPLPVTPPDGPLVMPSVQVTPPPVQTVTPPIKTTIIPDPVKLAVTGAKKVSNTIQLSAAKSGDPEPYIFGRCIATPRIIAGDDSGSYLVLDLLWSVGEIEGVEYMVYSNKNLGLGTSLGHNEHYSGTAGQAASPIMTALKGSYSAYANKAHSVVSIRAAGLDIKAMVKGLKLYDPRTATTVYSTNPALCLGRILTDCGYTMDATTWGAAADYCDESLGSPTQKRWEVGLQISDRQSLSYWVQTFAVYCNCFLEIIGGTVYMVPDAPRASNHTVTTSDIIEGTFRMSLSGSSDVPARVTASYTAIVESTVVDEFGLSNPYVTAETRTAETATSSNPGTTTSLSLPGVQDYSRARRYAVQTYNKAHNDLEIEFQSFDAGINRTVGDVGTVTNAQFGLSAQDMALVENRAIGRGRWQRRYRQYSASNYSDALFTEPDINTTFLRDPNSPPPGPTPTLTEELSTNVDGVTYSRIKIQFTGISWAYLQEYRLTITGDDGLYSETIDPRTSLGGGVTHTNYTTLPLTSGVTYTVNVYVRSVTNVLGTPGTADITSATGTNALVSVDLTLTQNMHYYVLDGDGEYVTSSTKTGSPALGETWASRFSDSPEGSQPWSAGETWLGTQTRVTLFVSEAWDSGSEWDGLWRFSTLNFTALGGAAMGHSVLLSQNTSPLSFSTNAGSQFSGLGQVMKAQSQVADSPITAGQGLHIKLPVPVSFELGA